MLLERWGLQEFGRKGVQMLVLMMLVERLAVEFGQDKEDLLALRIDNGNQNKFFRNQRCYRLT